MMARISGRKRVQAGRVIALLYLLCVLAPASAFAFGNARLADHCLFDADGLVTTTSHGATGDIGHQSGHQHAGEHSGAMHHHDAAQLAMKSQPGQASHDGQLVTDLPCCGTMCVVALPAGLAEIRTPRPTLAFVVPDRSRSTADGFMSPRYRPPIA